MQVGLAGNQTARAETILRALNLPVDVIGTSDGWGVEKPSAVFFDRVVAEAGCPADQVLYVGDRLDNDIRPAQAAGLATARYTAAHGDTSSTTRPSATAASSISTRWRSWPNWYAGTTSRPASQIGTPLMVSAGRCAPSMT